MIKKLLLTDWNFVRIFRLSLGISFAVYAIDSKDTVSGFVSLFLIFQAVTNTGCCGVSGCGVPVTKNNTNEQKVVEFEVINKEK